MNQKEKKSSDNLFDLPPEVLWLLTIQFFPEASLKPVILHHNSLFKAFLPHRLGSTRPLNIFYLAGNLAEIHN
jgi:hypothetical protein